MTATKAVTRRISSVVNSLALEDGSVVVVVVVVVVVMFIVRVVAQSMKTANHNDKYPIKIIGIIFFQNR